MFGKLFKSKPPVTGPAQLTASIPAGQRVYAVGDIHGRLDLLDELLAKIDADNTQRGASETTLIFLGDLIDRGPQSMQVVERIMDIKARHPRTRILLGNHEEVFLQAFRKLDSFKGESSLATWLYRLAMNLCLDRLRSRATRNDRRTESIEGRQFTARPGSGDAIGRIDLERAVAHLPEGARAAFLLHDVEGFDHREVGAILGISEGTSKSQVHKARMKIREFLVTGPKAEGRVRVSGE